MNAIIQYESILPSNLEDLSKFVLIGKEKLISVKAEIRAMKNLKFAEEVYKQKEVEAKELGGALLLAKVRIGELLKKIPKEQGKRTDLELIDTVVDKLKKEKVKDLGFSQKESERFQQLAENKDIVDEVIENSEDIPTQTECLKRIHEKKHPHVIQNTGDNEWYTPQKYIESAKLVMNTIDLDPASSIEANKIVQANNIFTIEDDGLSKDWFGNVWLNPPYSTDSINKFIDKLINELGHIEQCILLVNNATDTIWFQKIVVLCNSICFPKGRIKFYKVDSEKCSPLQGQCFLYFGDNYANFIKEFLKYGWCVKNER